ncbi:hypothetical protein MHA_1567 [Mannheimia haemolytica PHL213]|nr:hypothetical protein MHH_c13780 [Mannheimia haemolytica M42548]EDN74484.1 hypothetical protein MHA_1567 [Mannheimia haemolytica PHL213]EEY11201.1 hypothetical protein COI_0139 [Mannheimia haemolytica serotype A2 str. OVINE]
MSVNVKINGKDYNANVCFFHLQVVDFANFSAKSTACTRD